MGAGHGPDPPGGRHWGRTWLGVQPQDLRCLSRWRRCDGPRGRARQAATGTGGPVGSLRSLESGCVPPSARAPGRDCGQAAALGTGSVSVVPVSQKPLWKGLFSIKKSNRQGSEPGPITCCRGPSLRRRNSLAASLHRAARRRPFSGHLSLPSEEHCPPRDPPPQPSAARRQQQTSEEDKRPAGPVWHVPPVPSRGAACGLCSPGERGGWGHGLIYQLHLRSRTTRTNILQFPLLQLLHSLCLNYWEK